MVPLNAHSTIAPWLQNQLELLCVRLVRHHPQDVWKLHRRLHHLLRMAGQYIFWMERRIICRLLLLTLMRIIRCLRKWKVQCNVTFAACGSSPIQKIFLSFIFGQISWCARFAYSKRRTMQWKKCTFGYQQRVLVARRWCHGRWCGGLWISKDRKIRFYAYVRVRTLLYIHVLSTFACSCSQLCSLDRVSFNLAHE